MYTNYYVQCKLFYILCILHFICFFGFALLCIHMSIMSKKYLWTT